MSITAVVQKADSLWYMDPLRLGPLLFIPL
jgi:hypothetical protein